MNREDFPALHQKIHHHDLVYLDNAATTHKPQCVIDAVTDFYNKNNSNVHRGVHTLSARATFGYEGVRDKIVNYINAESTQEIIFTKGTTESINLVAQSFIRPNLQPGDEICISAMEHHANIVPWQMLCEESGATLKIIPVLDNGELDLSNIDNLLNNKTKILALIHISNVLGTINPIKKIIDLAHSKNIPVLIDGAQAMPHMKVDMQELDCDFYCFSAHKLFGPTGVGVLYGKKKLLENMQPYQFGGDMIRQVSFEKTEFNDLPYKFEAGTPNIAGVIGLGAAIEYVSGLDFEEINKIENNLLDYAHNKLSNINGLNILGTADHKAAVISFVFDDIHAHDVGTILDQYGIAVRTGHHCAMPLMNRFNVPATSRASFSFYNTIDEVDKLIEGLLEVKRLFA